MVVEEMPAGLEIRDTSESDIPAIVALYPRAFPQEDLVPLVNELLAATGITRSLAAVVDGQIAGHIVFTRCGVEARSCVAALLGPLAVDPMRQGQGIGSALVRAGVTRLQEAGVSLVVVLGDPAFYGRLGFSAESQVHSPYPLPREWQGAWQSQRIAPISDSVSGRLEVPSPWCRRALWAP